MSQTNRIFVDTVTDALVEKIILTNRHIQEMTQVDSNVLANLTATVLPEVRTNYAPSCIPDSSDNHFVDSLAQRPRAHYFVTLTFRTLGDLCKKKKTEVKSGPVSVHYSEIWKKIDCESVAKRFKINKDDVSFFLRSVMSVLVEKHLLLAPVELTIDGAPYSVTLKNEYFFVA
jgi:hypothetical protein